MASNKKWLWIGIAAAAVVIIAVACVLVFVVFYDDIFGGLTPQEQVVDEFMQAMEDQDFDAFLAVVDPESVEALKLMSGLDDAAFKEAMSEDVMSDSIKFEDIEMTTDLAEDGKSAIVTITAGKYITVDADGKETIGDAADADEGAAEFNVVLGDDGKWYLNLFGM